MRIFFSLKSSYALYLTVIICKSECLIKVEKWHCASDRRISAEDEDDERANDERYVSFDNSLSGNICTRISAVSCTDTVDVSPSISSTCIDYDNWDTRTCRFAYRR